MYEPVSGVGGWGRAVSVSGCSHSLSNMIIGHGLGTGMSATLWLPDEAANQTTNQPWRHLWQPYVSLIACRLSAESEIDI